MNKVIISYYKRDSNGKRLFDVKGNFVIGELTTTLPLKFGNATNDSENENELFGVKEEIFAKDITNIRNTYIEKIEYYMDHDTITSSLVYPGDKGYYFDEQLDDAFVTSCLRRNYSMKYIGNKYAVELTTPSGVKILVTNHDGKHFVISKK